jgi:hypothetical protein
MATFSKVEGDLKNLIGTTTIGKIVDTIKSIDKLSIKNQQLTASQPSPYKDLDYFPMSSIRDMKVDFTYQRFLRLRVLFNHLDTNNANGRFIASRAGALNVRRRKDGEEYLWDGLRRAVLAGIKNIWELPALVIPHDMSLTETQQQREEAEDFSAFNGKATEKMRKEEIWKSDCIAQDSKALVLKDIFRDCKIDVLSVIGNDDYTSLGGFATFQNSALGWGRIEIERDYLIRACDIIRNSFPNDKSFKGMAVVGVAYYLKTVDKLYQECQNDDETSLDCELVDDLYLDDQIITDQLTDYVTNGEDIVQANIINPNQSNRQIESVSYNLFNKVIKNHFKGERKERIYSIQEQLIDTLGLEKDNFIDA